MKTKKEFKDAYKQMQFPMGVYQVKNLVNGRVLIDNSVDMESKWNRHKMELKLGNHRIKELQHDWNKYGENHFEFKILSELKKSEAETVDYNKELKMLQTMVLEELKVENIY